MREQEYRDWLSDGGAHARAAHNTRVFAIKTIEQQLRTLGSPHTSLEDAWTDDRFEWLRDRLRAIREDAKAGGSQYRVLMPGSENPHNRLASWGSWLNQYGRFLDGERQEHKDADKIRRYVLDEVIEPAREGSAITVDVLVRDVNSALELREAWPNISQALAGKKMQELANITPPQRIGADASTATIFRFDLDPTEYWAENVLREKYGEPINRTKKIASFATEDGRHVALDLEAAATQIWLEGTLSAALLPEGSVRHYAANAPRNSNLPARLKHGGTDARAVSLITVANAEILQLVLHEHSGKSSTFEAGLRLLRDRFMLQCPEFQTFANPNDTWVVSERAYKVAAGEKVQTARQEVSDDEELGRQVFLILKTAANDGPLVRWQTEDSLIKKWPEALVPFYSAIGRLVRTSEPMENALNEAFEVFQTLKDAGADALTTGEQVNILFTAAAMVRPNDVAPAKVTVANQAAKELGEGPLFGSKYEAQSYTRFKSLLGRVFDVMATDWGWGPRDFLDVQGFLWIALKYQQSGDAPVVPDDPIQPERNLLMKPTNLILYGPPGTGKTYRTALEAVRLCDGAANYPDSEAGRAALMKRYDELVKNRQIDFVTFHQNFSYEDFIEGLRPVPLESENGSAAGFQLHPEAGIFQRISERASKPIASGEDQFALENRNVFKISLGQSNQAQWDWVYEQSLEEGYAYLGFKDVDWSAPKFAEREAIFAELQKQFPEELITSQMGVVKSPDRFRNQLAVGDVVIASKGLNAFRAIGIVEGEYEYAPRPDGRYCHRRKVRWLWDDPEGVPVSEIAEKRFSLDTVYPIPKSRLNLAAIKRYVNSVEADDQTGELIPHVLIIDEINRANISKVFGELITLLEPDKRLGQANALTVRLPYSKREFGVPSNLHVIGTMNTADRSIALLDTALRRRFRFEEMAPDTSVAAFKEAEERTGLPLGAVLETINRRIEYLVDRDHRIGHAFFIGCQVHADVDEVMRHKVIPLLQEYFFDDWNRLAAVLGEKKGKEGAFLSSELIQDPTDNGGDPLTSWRVRPEFAANAYHRILGQAGPANDEEGSAGISDVA